MALALPLRVLELGGTGYASAGADAVVGNNQGGTGYGSATVGTRLPAPFCFGLGSTQTRKLGTTCCARRFGSDCELVQALAKPVPPSSCRLPQALAKTVGNTG